MNELITRNLSQKIFGKLSQALRGFILFLLVCHVSAVTEASEGDNGVSLLKQIASAETSNEARKILFDVWKEGNYVMDLETRAFFEEVTSFSEFSNEGKKSAFIRKWGGDIPFAVWSAGYEHIELKNELVAVVSELNIYMETAQFVPARRSEDVKFWVILDDEHAFLKLKPNAKPYLENNFGLFWCNWGRTSKIMTSCAVFIDTERAYELQWQKHLLREEVTQAVGLMNDSPEYPDSMFYSKLSDQTEFSYRDIWSIYELYRRD